MHRWKSITQNHQGVEESRELAILFLVSIGKRGEKKEQKWKKKLTNVICEVGTIFEVATFRLIECYVKFLNEQVKFNWISKHAPKFYPAFEGGQKQTIAIMFILQVWVIN